MKKLSLCLSFVLFSASLVAQSNQEEPNVLLRSASSIWVLTSEPNPEVRKQASDTLVVSKPSLLCKYSDPYNGQIILRSARNANFCVDFDDSKLERSSALCTYEDMQYARTLNDQEMWLFAYQDATEEVPRQRVAEKTQENLKLESLKRAAALSMIATYNIPDCENPPRAPISITTVNESNYKPYYSVRSTLTTSILPTFVYPHALASKFCRDKVVPRDFQFVRLVSLNEMTFCTESAKKYWFFGEYQCSEEIKSRGEVFLSIEEGLELIESFKIPECEDNR